MGSQRVNQQAQNIVFSRKPVGIAFSGLKYDFELIRGFFDFSFIVVNTLTATVFFKGG